MCERVEAMNPVYAMRIIDCDDLHPRGFSESELVNALNELGATRHDYDMLMESATFEEVDAYYNPGTDEISPDYILEAIVVDKFSKTERRMAAVVRVLNRHLAGKEITALDAIVGKPRKRGSFAYVTVQLPFSDGQVVSVIFHAPEGDRKKITPSDRIVAFQWLLNKRDITQVVAPEDGSEVSLESIGKRITQLVVKNSARFERTQKEAAAERKALDEAREAVKNAEDKQRELMDGVAQASKDAETVTAQLSNTLALLEKQKTINAELQAKLDAMRKARPQGGGMPAGTSGGGADNGENGNIVPGASSGGASDGELSNGNVVDEITDDRAAKLNLPQAGKVILRDSDLAQIEGKHGKEVRHAGFTNAKAFVGYVLADIEAVYKAGGSAYSLVRTLNDKSSGQVVVELEYVEKDGVYRITTAHIARSGYFKNKKPLSERAHTNRSDDGTPSATWGESGVGSNMNHPAADVNPGTLQFVTSVPANAIKKTADKTAVQVAMDWIEKNVSDPVQTKVGEVVVDKNAVQDSLSHSMYQSKLDAVQAIVPVLQDGEYLGSLPDKDGKQVENYYFAGKVRIGDAEKIVFVRTRRPYGSKNKFYVHEVFTEEEIGKAAARGTGEADADRRFSNAADFYRSILAGSTKVNEPQENQGRDPRSDPSQLGFVSTLNDILSGRYDADTSQIGKLLREALSDAKAAGQTDAYHDLFQQALDHRTELLRKQVEGK